MASIFWKSENPSLDGFLSVSVNRSLAKAKWRNVDFGKGAETKSSGSGKSESIESRPRFVPSWVPFFSLQTGHPRGGMWPFPRRLWGALIPHPLPLPHPSPPTPTVHLVSSSTSRISVLFTLETVGPCAGFPSRLCESAELSAHGRTTHQ